ncbi:hypothetical protein, partial [Vaccinium witches'-broom phytoplasma]|uniref:hypothetical protein n=1 Tax=Vaccinium witches'-broom phytoplasma TaxID=85642 RepID=UPI000571A357
MIFYQPNKNEIKHIECYKYDSNTNKLILTTKYNKNNNKQSITRELDREKLISIINFQIGKNEIGNIEINFKIDKNEIKDITINKFNKFMRKKTKKGIKIINFDDKEDKIDNIRENKFNSQTEQLIETNERQPNKYDYEFIIKIKEMCYIERELFQNFRHFLLFKNSLRLTIKLVFF